MWRVQVMLYLFIDFFKFKSQFQNQSKHGEASLIIEWSLTNAASVIMPPLKHMLWGVTREVTKMQQVWIFGFPCKHTKSAYENTLQM